MKAIGGYPELELRKGKHYHKDAIRLNTARNCLEYLLLARQYKKVYLPYYTCEAVLEPFDKSPLDVPEIGFYQIDINLDPTYLPDLKDGEAFLYTNYFGLKQDTVERLVKAYGSQLIVDNSQAFFDMPYQGVDTFYSARKFFGVPDGAYLYTEKGLSDYYGVEIELDHSHQRMMALMKRIDLSAEDGYSDFQKTEESLSLQPIRYMSPLTEMLLSSIDYDLVRSRRRENYMMLYRYLFTRQKFWLRLTEKAVPLCYPYLTDSSSLKQSLISGKIFVPTYWPNVIKCCDDASVEYLLAERLLPLPIDQRYGKEEMERIISKIKLYEQTNMS